MTTFVLRIRRAIRSWAALLIVFCSIFRTRGKKNVASNRHMIAKFFASAAKVLSAKGEIHLSIKTTARYNFWRVEELAASQGLHPLGVERFAPDELYTHRRTKHDGYRPGIQLDYCARWRFGLEPPAKSFERPLWLKEEQNRESHTCELCDMIFTTAGDLSAHLGGKKHQGRLRQEKRKFRIAEKKERKANKKARTTSVGTGSEGSGGAGTGQRRWCAMCKTFSNSEKDYENHLKGKRHRETLAELNAKKRAGISTSKAD